MPDPYLTAAEVRTAWPILANTTTHPSSEIEALVEEFETIAERARGVAYRVRTATWSGRAVGSGSITLPHPKVVAVSAVSVDATALTAEQLADLDPVDGESLLNGGTWARGQQLVVTYTHGFTEPPPAILRACKEFVRAKRLAATSNQPRNILSYQDPDTGYSYRESTANWPAGRYTGLMVVDDAINSVEDYRIPGFG